MDTDHRQPSCLLRGSTGSAGAVRVKAPLTVAADRWYHAACTRTANTLTISVQAFDAARHRDGEWSRSATNPRGFGSPTWTKTRTPLSIGGKLTAANKLVGGSADHEKSRGPGAKTSVLVVLTTFTTARAPVLDASNAGKRAARRCPTREWIRAQSDRA